MPVRPETKETKIAAREVSLLCPLARLQFVRVLVGRRRRNPPTVTRLRPRTDQKDRNMNSYETSNPRVAMGLAAAAMAAMTIGAMIVLPAKLEAVSAEPYALAVARAATLGPIDFGSPASSTAADAPAREEQVQRGGVTFRARASRVGSPMACLHKQPSSRACL
jgi:hypothetical protein